LLRRKRFWFGLLISFSFLAFFLARTPFADIGRSFGQADLVLACAVAPLYFVGFWLRTLRWRFLLRHVSSISTLNLYPIVLIGLMTNNVAPARVGELVRAYLLGEKESMSKSTALGTIAVDRAFDGLTLVAILGVAIALAGANTGVKSVGIGTAIVFTGMSTVLVALAFSPTRARAVLLHFIRMAPASVSARVEGLLDSFLIGLGGLRSPGALLGATIMSFASWMVEGFMYYLIGQAFHLNVNFEVYLIILAGANLALSILASPGGVGPFEATTQAVLIHFMGSSSASLATAYALALHALLLGPVIIVGFVLLWTTQLSLGQLLSGTRPASPASPMSTGIE
jgi:uncharacterized protein (TIRG00374 family)